MKILELLRNQETQPCGRSACNRTGATWYNGSTKGWYCPRCADAINAHNGGHLCFNLGELRTDVVLRVRRRYLPKGVPATLAPNDLLGVEGVQGLGHAALILWVLRNHPDAVEEEQALADAYAAKNPRPPCRVSLAPAPAVVDVDTTAPDNDPAPSIRITRAAWDGLYLVTVDGGDEMPPPTVERLDLREIARRYGVEAVGACEQLAPVTRHGNGN